MLKYYIKSIAYNKRRHFLILSISTIGFGFIFFIVQLISSLSQTANTNEPKNDSEEMLYLLIALMVSIGASIVGLLTAAYKIMYYGRTNEILHLHQIGCSKERITNIFCVEIIILSVIITCLGMILGNAVVLLFEHYYSEAVNSDSSSVSSYLVLANLVFCITLYGQFKQYRDDVLITSTDRENLRRCKKKPPYSVQMRNQFLSGVTVLFIYFFMKNTMQDFQTIYQYIEEKSMDELLITIVCFVCIRSMIYGICRGLNWIAGKLLLSNLHLAMKHIINEIEPMMKLIANMIYSICLILFFLVMFYSTTSSQTIFNKTKVTNTWYTEKASEELEQPRVIHESREELITHMKASVLGGTEMVMIILYLYVISSMFMLFNMFIISLKNRRTCNENLITIGLTRQRIFQTQFIEMLIVVMIGILLGCALAGISIAGLPSIMNLLYGLRVQIYVPRSVYLIVTGITICSILEIFVISYQAAKSENSCRLEVEGVL